MLDEFTTGEPPVPHRTGEKHFTASALIADGDGRFLLHFHSKLTMWLYPGGHVEPNEEPQDAVRREVLEEANIDVDVLSCGQERQVALQLEPRSVAELPVPLSLLCERIPGASGEHHWHMDLVYLCQKRGAQTPAAGFEWLTVEEVSALACPRELPSLMQRGLAVLSGRLSEPGSG